MTVTVAMLQGPYGRGAHPDIDGNVAAIDRAATWAAVQGAQILVTPEMSVTGYDIGPAVAELARERGGEYHRRIGAIAARSGVAIVFGYGERVDDRVYNSAAVIVADDAAPDGWSERAHYRKTHLFGDSDRAQFAPGDSLTATFSFGDLTCGLLICYDVEFPEAVRAHADSGTDLLFVPTGLMEPYGRIAELLVPARALENQMYVAYANRCGREATLEYCGGSIAATPTGDIAAQAGKGESLELFIADPAVLSASRSESTYLNDRRTDLYNG